MRKSYQIFGPIFCFLFGTALGWDIWKYGPQDFFCYLASMLLDFIGWVQESYVCTYKNGDLKDLLLTIAQIEGVLASIAIPLGLNMTARISERYRSSAVSVYFRKVFIFKWFPGLMLLILGANLFGLIFYLTSLGLWISFFSIILAAVSLGLSFCFLTTLKNHTDAHYLLKKVGKDVQKIITA